MKINIGGKERGLQFGLGAIEIYCETMFCDLLGLDMIGKFGMEQARAIGTLIYAALANYADLNDEPIDFNVRKVQSWIDDLPQSDFEAIMEDFRKSKFLGKSLEDHFAASTEVGNESAETKKKSL
jgi:hypothetical protein